MKFRKLFENWDLKKLKIKLAFLDMEWEPSEPDKDAAWELYIELLTRVTTQDLLDDNGNEESALNSVYSIFSVTRSVLKNHGRDCIQFSKIAIIVVNQIIRPFTSKWHQVLVEGTLTEPENRDEFRLELKKLQKDLKIYTKVLSEIAGVEDLSELEAD